MYKPYEIAHPLRNIELMAEYTKEMSADENKLLESYRNVHDQQFELEKQRQQMQLAFPEQRNKLLEMRKEFKLILQQITNIKSESDKLLLKQPDYKTFKIGFDAIVEGSLQYNDNLNMFVKRSDKMTEDMVSLATSIDQYNKSINELNTSLDTISDIHDSLYEEYNENSVLSIISFENDMELFTEMVTSGRKEFDQLYATVNMFIDEEHNPFMEYYSDSVKIINDLNDNIQKLQNAYLKYTKAKEADNDLIYLEWQEEKPFQNPEEIIKYGMTYDIEFGKKGGIILHLDSLIVIDGMLDIWQRWSYRMKCPMAEVFTAEIMEPLVGHCLEGLKTEIQESAEKNKRNFDMKMITPNYEVVKNVTGSLLEIVPEDHKLLTKDDDMYKPWFRISKAGIFKLLGLTVMNVFDQLLFINKNFDNRKNQEKLSKITAIGHYISLRTHIIEMLDAEITLNLRQYTHFLMWMDCVSQLLLGDHEADFIHYLEVANIKAETRMEYLKQAQKHFKEALEHFRKNEITVPYLEKTRNWNSIFF